MFIKKAFKYIEPLWLGRNGKVSIRSTLALLFSGHFMRTITHAVLKWDDGRSMSDLALILGTEAALIAALLALRTYQNVQMDNRENTGGYYDPSNNDPDRCKGSQSVGTN